MMIFDLFNVSHDIGRSEIQVSANQLQMKTATLPNNRNKTLKHVSKYIESASSPVMVDREPSNKDIRDIQ
ncbi:hypothetical protein YC2023_093916 [Brassica napus]